MMTGLHFLRRPKGLIALAAVAGLVAGLAGVYVSGWATVHTAARCAPSKKLADALKPHARGELAGLLPADVPEELSGLAFRTADGKPVVLADFGGKIVLVNLWATWCAPCRAEMPALDRLAASRAGPDFALLTLNVDVGSPDKPRAFLDEIGVKALPDYRDPKMAAFNDLKQRGLTFGLPTTLVVDRNGCEVAVLHGPAAWDSAEAGAMLETAVAYR